VALHGRYFQIFVLNLCAPFIVQVFGAQLPHIDYPTGNEAESEAWASAKSPPDPNDLPAVIKALAQQKSNPTRNRTVAFTHGTTIIVRSSSPDDVKTYAVDAFKDEEIVDTDGAGDAFAGGSLGALATGKSLDETIGVVHTPGTMFVTQVGPQYEWLEVKVL